MVDTVVHGSSGSDAGTPYPTVTLVELLYPTKVSPGSPEDKASLHSRAYEHRGMPCKELCHLQHTGSWWCQSLMCQCVLVCHPLIYGKSSQLGALGCGAHDQTVTDDSTRTT